MQKPGSAKVPVRLTLDCRSGSPGSSSSPVNSPTSPMSPLRQGPVKCLEKLTPTTRSPLTRHGLPKEERSSSERKSRSSPKSSPESPDSSSVKLPPVGCRGPTPMTKMPPNMHGERRKVAKGVFAASMSNLAQTNVAQPLLRAEEPSSLTLQENVVGPWEKVSVAFSLTGTPRKDDFIGMYSTDVGPDRTDMYDGSLMTRGKQKGSCTFIAPNVDGSYVLRFVQQDIKVIASVEFRVVVPEGGAVGPQLRPTSANWMCKKVITK